jgi:hypothetical protein
MKIRYIPGVVLLLALMSHSSPATAQFNKVEQYVTFASRLDAPINLDVKQIYGKLVFTISNKSYYPYEVEIKFSKTENLIPLTFDKKAIAPPGNSTLLTLNLINNDLPPQYIYSLRYRIGNPSQKPDFSFLYLIPLAKGEAVEFAVVKSNDVKTFYRNQFVLDKGDPVFCARRGIVTSLSGYSRNADIILKSSSIEIRHADGTVASYKGVVVNHGMFKPGDIVYPGQQIGTAAGSIPVELAVFAFKGDGMIENLNFNYALIDGQPLTVEGINGKEVSWPESLITKEMTKKEVTQYKKGALYK